MNTDTQAAGPDPIRDPETSALTEPLAQDPAQPSAPQPEPASAPPSAAQPAASQARATVRRPRPRTGPIVWGALILALCGYVAQRTLNPSQLDTTTWLTSTVIGLGLLLLGVGAAVLIRNSRR